MNGISDESGIIRNLKDSGCDEETIRKFLKLKRENRTQEQYRLLSLHRVSLLDQVHISQHMIDCLDYLIYTMKNTTNK